MELSDDSKPEQISLDALSCDAAMGKFPSLPIEEALKVRRPCSTAHHEGYLACRNPHFSLFVDEGEGLDLVSKIVSGVSLSLGIYIPVPDRDSSKLPIHFSKRAPIGMRIGDLYPKALSRPHRNLLYREKPEIDRSYLDRPIFRNQDVLLFSSGPDALVEGLMRDREEIALFPTIASLGFVAVTALDLSVNVGDCYAGQMLNMARSLVFAREIEIAGSPAIPNVFAGDTFQRRLWADYINVHRIPTVSMNCQLQKRKKEDVEFDKETIRYLLENSRHELHMILHGFSLTRSHMRGLELYMSRLHFADSAPFYDAHMNMQERYNPLNGELESFYCPTTSPEEKARVVEENIRAREKFLHNVWTEHVGAAVVSLSKRVKKRQT